ncbi:helix-turn-helix transcriptional regulator [Rhodopirellula sp. MGV]|uniref:helix-turn-helix transcriptional regulator n=1 Tax=Rhodopirellula sp. MGV TaxID=2023130 RepID=UPI0013041D52|nr:helix-turn-helix transcriptional regulator [Rhodopirellula sp. MGV]
MVETLLASLYLPRWETAMRVIGTSDCVRIPDGTAVLVVVQGGEVTVTLAGSSDTVHLTSGDHAVSTGAQETLIQPAGGAAKVLLATFDAIGLEHNRIDKLLPSLTLIQCREFESLRRSNGLLENAARLGFDGETWGNQLIISKLAEAILLQALATELDRSIPDFFEMPQELMDALSDRNIGPVIRKIWSDPSLPWTVPMMARLARLSRSTFAERFRSLVGEPPLRHLTEVRMKLACRLLSEGGLGVTAIGRMVGYENGSSFSNSFKKWANLSPLEFRKQAHGAPLGPDVQMSDKAASVQI